MPNYAAFLRGINLGPRRRVSAEELRSLFGELGFRDVAPFRSSGNVVFATGREPAMELRDRIQDGLAGALGYEVEVFLRTAREIRAIAERRPFAAEMVDDSKGKLQVLMLSGRPTARARNETLALATDQDRLAFGDRELYWLPSGGIRDSALDQRAIAKLLGSTTMRTKGTVEQLAAKYFAG